MYLDDQPVRIGQNKGTVLCEFIDFENYARAARLKLRHPDFFEEAIVHIKALAHQG